MKHVDLLIAGAGPAGMGAALSARQHGLSVLVVDDQPTPGGQIWRSVEMATGRDALLGAAYTEGRRIAREFRDCGAIYMPDTQLWQIEPGFEVFVSQNQKARAVEAAAVILATGAQERPAPFPGWTLPGVMTVGAAQILLKTAGQLPAEPVWIAGSGPLPLLYMVQLLKAGGKIAGFLDTTPPGQWVKAVRHLPGALRSIGDLVKGLAWTAALRLARAPVVTGVSAVEALGADRLRSIRYRDHRGRAKAVEASVLLTHEGLVPAVHAPMAVGCQMRWDLQQDCYVPVLDAWGESSTENLFIAGDGAGIAGAKAALLRGKLAGLRVAAKLGKLGEAQARLDARPLQRRLRRELAARPFLDALFRPRNEVFTPTDDTVICRCEEITAGDVRALAAVGQPGPNQVKAATRVGMGPCQGRQCGYTVARILAAEQQLEISEVGYFHVRPPLKPLTLGELAAVEVAAS